ncbi:MULTISPECIES: hypothetical protein [unclassified Sphingomonas]|uniref:hypothetical protein n=1 Tax=unclassified Sphingomonas TaxID=196159 RepID=UPI000E106994|nr:MULTISPECIES: hypothetical protein [unclassified Sphingomonas]AXJ97097.1 hypothetical protein DM480_13270 [Sphingomonas sp. FARSPH]
MIALLMPLALQATTPAPTRPAPLSLGPIGQQALPAKGCAAYLWSIDDRQLVAMATAATGTLRIAPGGATIDLAKSGETGAGDFGFAASTTYAAGGVAATLDLTIRRQQALTAGARVETATLRIDRPGQDSLVVPLAGLIGCAA